MIIMVELSSSIRVLVLAWLSLANLGSWLAQADGTIDHSISSSLKAPVGTQPNCGRAPLNKRSIESQTSEYLNGGKSQIYGEWPSFATISVEAGADPSSRKNKTLCSGVVISRAKVLTAGHCLMISENRPWDIKNLFVTTGNHKTNTIDKYQRSFRVQSTCKSSAYARSPFNRFSHDFAVLNLASPIEPFDNHTQPACLPRKSPEFDTKRGHCHVIGAGYTHHEPPLDGIGPDIVKYPKIIQVMPVKRESCQQFRVDNKANVTLLEDIDISQFCWTRSGGQGTICKGDSGGPILCLNENDRWTVVGVASYAAILCDGKEMFGFNGVYAKIQTALGQMQECF